MSHNPFSLEGKTILITGASSGIGRTIAIECSKMGATVVITGRNEERLKETFSSLVGQNNFVIIGDITLHQTKIIESLPVLDGLVNAAGIIAIQPFQFISEEELKKIFEVNFFSPILLIKQIIKKKLLNKNSSIVFISSLAGNVIVSKGNAVYGASKSALMAIAKTMALELASKKIRVNSILPGMVKTEMMKRFLQSLTSEQLEEDEKKYPFGYGTPEDVAFAAVYLLSDASKWTTGSSLILDGGFSLQ
jgi:NAD(P)-dependent dehydrogenase (short-subunit alcohol dehydrogenase family)